MTNVQKNKKQKITYKKNIDDDVEMMQTESSKGNQTDTGLPESFNQFGEDLKYKLAKMHEQFKVNFETTHANSGRILPAVNNKEKSSNNLISNKLSTSHFSYWSTSM